jgi:hypothetical protein
MVACTSEQELCQGCLSNCKSSWYPGETCETWLIDTLVSVFKKCFLERNRSRTEHEGQGQALLAGCHLCLCVFVVHAHRHPSALRAP